MAQSKTKQFRDLLDAGKTMQEAQKESEVSDATARTQYYKWKKEKGESQE